VAVKPDEEEGKDAKATFCCKSAQHHTLQVSDCQPSPALKDLPASHWQPVASKAWKPAALPKKKGKLANHISSAIG
jgi:hypothetical protein